jgi:hypothetical protein
VEIRGSSGAVWAKAFEPYPGEVPRPGELDLRVDVSTCGFTGYLVPTVQATALRAFLTALEAMQTDRDGEAVLPGVTDEFTLRIAWEERAGGRRLAATGRITRYADAATDGGPHANVLQFGLDFPESAFPRVVAGVRAMVEGLTERTAAQEA